MIIIIICCEGKDTMFNRGSEKWELQYWLIVLLYIDKNNISLGLQGD